MRWIDEIREWPRHRCDILHGNDGNDIRRFSLRRRIAQTLRVAVLPQDDAASLHARIQRAEHVLLPQVVDAIARGRYTLGPTPRFMTSDALSAPDAWIWPKLSD